MPDKFWDKPQILGPSAGLVQRHFVEARLDQLMRKSPVLEKQVAEILTNHPLLSHLNLKANRTLPVAAQRATWQTVYDKITKNLQTAEVTINFNASSWFTNENLSDSYTQVYERNVGTNGKVFMSETDRAVADDRVTFPKPKPGHIAPPHRGVLPGRQGQERIENQMRFAGGATTRTVNGRVLNGVENMNPHFNPKTKQIFAALNYGRRPHGSAAGYGKSYLVLNDKFKLNALYFPCDTFLPGVKASNQRSYDTLGTILVCPYPQLQEAIIKSCYLDISQPDQDSGLGMRYLLEAHIFSDLKFAGNIKAVCVAEHPGSICATNARKFAARIGANLFFV